MKIAINRCYGGFGLPEEAYEFLGLKWDKFGYEFDSHSKRSDPDLIRVIETLGEKASGKCAKLEVIEIPDNVDWEIDDYDGIETIHEKHRSWR
jgi:hypothetical protein